MSNRQKLLRFGVAKRTKAEIDADIQAVHEKRRDRILHELDERGRPLSVADNYARLALNGVATVMLMVAVFGHPPYPFFGYMRWIVVAACAGAAWLLLSNSGWMRVVGVVAASSGLVEGFAHFRREDWVLPNLITVGLLVFASLVECLVLWKARTEQCFQDARSDSN